MGSERPTLPLLRRFRLPGLRATMLRRLLLLIAAIVAPLVLLGGWIVETNYESVRAAIEDRLLDGARTLAAEVDAEFARGEAVLLALAASSALRRGDLDAFEGEMRAVAQGLGVGIALATRDGFQALNTVWAPGERRQGVPVPAFVQDTLATGQARVSDLFVGPSDGRAVVALAVPVRAPAAAGGAPAVSHALGFVLPRARFLDMLGRAAATAPDHWVGAVFDRTGRFVARSRGDRRAIGQSAQPDVLELLARRNEGVARERKDREGNTITSAFARAPRSGFAVVVGANRELLYAPLWSAVQRGVAAVAAVLLCCLAWAVVGSRRVAAAFRRVPDGVLAAAAAGGKAPAPAAAARSTGLREADDLAAALSRALRERDRAVADLQAVFDVSPVGMARVDMGGRVKGANDAFLRIVGADRGRLRAGAVRWDAITPPEFLDRDEAAIAEAVRHGRCAPYEKEYVRPDGRRVPVLIAFALLDRERGEGAAFVVDLSAQKRTAVALAGDVAAAETACAGDRRRTAGDGADAAGAAFGAVVR